MRTPIESWLRAFWTRKIEILPMGNRIGVAVYESDICAGSGIGDSIEEACAAAMNDAMVRAHAKEEARDG